MADLNDTIQAVKGATAGEWLVNRTVFNHAVIGWHIAAPKHGSAYPICNHGLEREPDGSEQLANAAAIVAAVNYLRAHGDELLAVLGLCRREIDLLAWDLHASGTVDGEWPDNKFAAQDREEHARLTALLARIDALAAAEGGGG